MRGTASPLELTWTGFAALGVLMTAWMLIDAWLDWHAVQHGIRGGWAVAYGPRWWIALGALGGNGMTGLVWFGFLVVGVIAMQFPPPPPNVEQATSSQVSGWVLIAMEGLLAVTQVWARVVRLKVVALTHVHEPEAPS